MRHFILGASKSRTNRIRSTLTWPLLGMFAVTALAQDVFAQGTKEEADAAEALYASSKSPYADEACEAVKDIDKKLKSGSSGAFGHHFRAAVVGVGTTMSGFALTEVGKQLDKKAMVEALRVASKESAQKAMDLSKQLNHKLHTLVENFYAEKARDLAKNPNIGQDLTRARHQFEVRLPAEYRQELAKKISQEIKVPPAIADDMAEIITRQAGREVRLAFEEASQNVMMNGVLLNWEGKVGGVLARKGLQDTGYFSRVLTKAARDEIKGHAIIIRTKTQGAAKAGKLTASKCLRVAGKVLKVAGPVLGVAMEIAFASKAYAATRTAEYMNNPSEFLDEYLREGVKTEDFHGKTYTGADAACLYLAGPDGNGLSERLILMKALLDEAEMEIDHERAEATTCYAEESIPDTKQDDSITGDYGRSVANPTGGDDGELLYCPDNQMCEPEVESSHGTNLREKK